MASNQPKPQSPSFTLQAPSETTASLPSGYSAEPGAGAIVDDTPSITLNDTGAGQAVVGNRNRADSYLAPLPLRVDRDSARGGYNTSSFSSAAKHSYTPAAVLGTSRLAVPGGFQESYSQRSETTGLRPSTMGDASASGGGGDSGATSSPFNFTTQTISTTPTKANIGQRRGHRYKHSSISAQHQIFKEPPQRPPPVLPASLPIPTLREARERMTTEQWHSLYWSLCHLGVAAFLFFRSKGSLGIMALSHLVFFDAGSALICTAVDVLGNFEVWRRSSIRHPFGLERAEVIAGFAMSIFLIFGGFDLVSHGLKHWLETKGSHEPHHEHSHAYEPTDQVEWIACAGIASTLVSAYWVKNHGRIARIMRASYLSVLSHHFSNVFHVLTIFFSILVFLLPLMPGENHTLWDRAVCAAISCAMFVFGAQLGMAQGSMLLMSYRSDKSSKSVSAVLQEIESEPNVSRVEDAQFWQVHYGLCMANLKICVPRGCDEGTIGKLRSRISSMIQNRLGEGYGRGTSLRWEVTIQTSVDDV